MCPLHIGGTALRAVGETGVRKIGFRLKENEQTIVERWSGLRSVHARSTRIAILAGRREKKRGQERMALPEVLTHALNAGSGRDRLRYGAQKSAAEHRPRGYPDHDMGHQP